MNPRPYQQETVEAIHRHLRDRDDNAVCVIPTEAAGDRLFVQSTCCTWSWAPSCSETHAE